MEEGKSFSEICQDLLVVLKNFQKAYFEAKKDLYDPPVQEEEKEQEGQQAKERKNGKEETKIQEEKEQMEQEKKAANLQDYISEGKVDTQQLDRDIISEGVHQNKKKGKKRKANGTRLNGESWIKGGWNHWNREMKSRRPMGNIIGLGMGEGGRGDRGRKGSFKTRKKKKKERMKLMDWNFKEFG